MKKLVALLCVPFLARSGFADNPPVSEPMNQLSNSAERELAKSIQDLNQLREQRDNEKLPLSQELTALEEKVTALRREHDRVTRLVDASNLEIATIKNDMKKPQDELAYIGNL